MKRKSFFIVFLSLAFLLLEGCSGKTEEFAWIKKAIDRADYQFRESSVKFEADSATPRSYKDGKYRMAPPKDWTSGFYPGSLWYLYELTGDKFFEEKAEVYTAKLHEIPFYKGTHDLGFMIYCSYGNQQRVLHDTVSANAIINAAESLVSRQNPETGVIRSWDFGQWNYPVIIDNMMNLEMLFWASKHSDNPVYADIAVLHADKTIENHFRDDYSAYHVISYNNDGTVESKGTFQGYSDSSAWARGESWAFYGYVMCYRETGHERYLEQALKVADFFMNHPRVPEDLIPYWDYDAPNIPDAPRDASAAAVYASALLELSTMKVSNPEKYFDYAEKILKSLCSDAYLAPEGGNGDFVLMHCVGHHPANSEIDTPLNYADYYFLEAVKRYLNIKGVNPKSL